MMRRLETRAAAVASSSAAGVWLLIVACTTVVVTSFNIDTSVPIVKFGRSQSYFGFSVAQHPVWNERMNRSNVLIVVGAPRDNITSSEAPAEVQRIVRPGAVYSCPVSSTLDDCTQLVINNEVEAPGEDRSDQWMGVSVVSQGVKRGRVMACAHRYKKRGAVFVWGLGMCISLHNSLDTDRFWEPCESKPKDKAYGEYGFCQVGVSAALDADGNALFGSPGSYNWRGSIFSNVLDDELGTLISERQSPVEDALPDRSTPDPATGYYSYLGMSVKIGNIINGRQTFVAGAPRSRYTGQVLIFVPTPTGMSITPDHYLTGEQFGSGFGYDLVVADFNRDGKHDLVVSAPFYHAQYVSGAVYIYINGKEGITRRSVPTRILSRKMRDVECAQLGCHDARFGLSLAVAGDLDQDGYQDLLVGAPFEGSGAVYVFHGSASGIKVDYSQRITVSDLVVPGLRPLKSFGYSLSGGLDMDGNGYPDVAVGAFQSDALVVLRTRPVVNILTNLHTYPTQINPKETQCQRDGLPYNCFKLKACLRFTVFPEERFPGTMDVNMTFESEKFTGVSVPRAFFLENNKELHVLNVSLTMNRQADPQYKCVDIHTYIIRSNRDFLNPIKFQLTYKLTGLRKPRMFAGGVVPNLDTYPVINESLSRVYHSVDFIKNCGNDSKCDSNLLVRGLFQLNRDETGMYVLKVTQDRELRLVVRVRNSGEDAHEALVKIELPPSLEYLGTDSDFSCTLNEDDTVTCDVGNPLPRDHETSFTIRLDTNRLDSSVHDFEILLTVNTTSNEIDAEDNIDRIKVKVVIETDLAIDWFSDPLHVFYGGEVVGESGMAYLDDIGPEVMHGYEITHKGSGNIRNTIVTISWPYEVQSHYASGKHLLYLTEVPQVMPSGHCVIEQGQLNPLRLQSRPPSSEIAPIPKGITASELVLPVSHDDRQKREAGDSPQTLESLSDAESATLDCDSHTAKCCRIVCTIDKLPSTGSVVIKVKSRLWNSTFLEDYTNVHHVDIVSKAELTIDPSLNIRQLSQHNDVARARTRAFPDIRVQKPTAVPLWVIIASICAGVFLLILIVLLLCKCGFFRRRRKDDVGYYTAVKVKQADYYDIEH